MYRKACLTPEEVKEIKNMFRAAVNCLLRCRPVLVLHISPQASRTICLAKPLLLKDVWLGVRDREAYHGIAEDSFF